MAFSRECMLTVDASDVGVGAELQFFPKTLTKISKNNPQLKKNYLPYSYLCSSYDVHFIHS